MFKPQKPSGSQQPSRHKLPLTERPPKQEDIATLFTGALRIRGTIFELPIRPTPSSPVFIITCVFDLGCNETIWSMYEGSENSGPQLFSLPQSDLDMVFDMVCMACQPKGSASIPQELAPGGGYGPAVTPTTQQIPQGPVQYAPNYGTSQYSQPQPPPAQTQAQQPYAQPQQPYAQPQQPYAQPQQPYAQPPGPSPQAYQQAPAYDPYGPQAGNVPYNPYGQQQASYPQQAGYQQTPPQPTQPAQPASNQAPYQQSSGQNAASSFPGADIPIPDYSMLELLSKQGAPNVLIGQLFVGSGIVSERGLDAALKLQEMVREKKLTPEQSIMAMRRAAELGGNLDDDIIEWAKNPDARRKPGVAATSTTQSTMKPTQQAAAPARDNVAGQRIVDLLKQAALVNDDDLETARRIKSKHGGDIAQILVSAGKVSGKTVDAAGEAQNLVAVGRLRIDKAIMALHYCERMRVGLREALNELNIETT